MNDKPPSTPASRRDVCPFCRAGLRPQSRREIEERYVPVYTCGVVAWEDKWRGRQERTINCCEREIAALKASVESEQRHLVKEIMAHNDTKAEVERLRAERDKALDDYFKIETRLETYYEERPVKLGVRVCGHDVYIAHTAPGDVRRKASGDLVAGGVCRDRREAKEGEDE